MDDIERVKSVIGNHPSGITRKNIAKQLRMTDSRVRKAVKIILESDPSVKEVKKGKEVLLTTEVTPDWWKTMRSEIE